MNKHAPGPWKTTHSEVSGYRVSDSTGWGVAVVLKDVTDEANARLIAAAPQMLEALELAADYVKEVQGDESTDYKQVIAAIRAAKGEI